MQRITPQITIFKKIFRFLKKSSRHCSIALLSLQQTYAVNTIAMDRYIKALIILIIQYLCFHFSNPRLQQVEASVCSSGSGCDCVSACDSVVTSFVSGTASKPGPYPFGPFCSVSGIVSKKGSVSRSQNSGSVSISGMLLSVSACVVSGWSCACSVHLSSSGCIFFLLLRFFFSSMASDVRKTYPDGL